jgi:hypothetical protein
MISSGDRSTSSSSVFQVPLAVLAVVLLLAGICVRVLYLDEPPASIHNDESGTVIDMTPPFLTEPPEPIRWGQNNLGGHANFDAWMTSLSVKYSGGKTLWANRMGSMVCGVLSILFGALFVRSWLGLRAMVFFLVGVVPFHLHLPFLRTGFIYIQTVSVPCSSSLGHSQFSRAGNSGSPSEIHRICFSVG